MKVCDYSHIKTPEDLVLRCSPGHVIHVTSGLYGRTSGDVYSCGGSSSSCGKMDNGGVTVIYRQACDGHRTCRVPVAYRDLGDPCPGVPKYAQATYTCGKFPHYSTSR